MGAAMEIFRRIESEISDAQLRVGRRLLERAEDDAPVGSPAEEPAREVGELRRSGYVEQDGLTTEVGFRAEHAAAVHEDLNDEHPRGGKAKFLEDNVKAIAPEYAEELRAAARRGIEGR